MNLPRKLFVAVPQSAGDGPEVELLCGRYDGALIVWSPGWQFCDIGVGPERERYWVAPDGRRAVAEGVRYAA